MSKQNGYSLNGFIYVAGIFIIIRHIMQIITNIMWLSIGIEPAIIYNICIGAIIILLIILIFLQKKYALFAFFAFQFINGIVISVFDGKWVINLLISAILCTIVAAVLFLRHDGISAWKAILGNKGATTKYTNEQADRKPEHINHEQTISIPTTQEPQIHFEYESQPKEHIRITKQSTNILKKCKYIIIVTLCSVIIGGAIYMINYNHDSRISEKEAITDTIIQKNIIGNYLYIDKSNVLHTKNGCIAVFKDHNSQIVTPVEAKCLSNSYLEKVCSQCVSEKQIECLKDSFDKYRQVYINVGDIYQTLDSKYDGIPPILEFRRRMCEYNYARNIYEGMIDDNDYSGTFDEFMEYVGLSKTAKRKSKTQL